MSDSPIPCTIDLEAPGKQVGRLQVPRSSNASGWSNQYVPIVSVANGDGPTALVLGGVHGDEPEGQVAALNLARDAPAGAGQRPRDRDPVRLDRRLARLHAALAVGREHEPLVPRLADRAGRRAARALPLDRSSSRARTSSSTCTAAAARASACPGPRCTGSTTPSSGAQMVDGMLHWNTDWCCVYIDIARHRPARRRGRAAGQDRRQHRARRRRPRHRRDPPARVERPRERPPPLRRDRGRGRRAPRSASPSRCC